ncbi:Maf family protein [Anthocerotibacter panamensis]|uniref:Maf family protein n=1 Tax=Anthocerotibacter panamensis TaxID=2857077 RepID=UPI001C4050DF|nr:Maf family protein [Anthocerotibacter panamensis]
MVRTADPLILASTSPRRRELLTQLGIPFIVVPSPYQETNEAGLLPDHLVREQSLGKALAVVPDYPHQLILGADTLVVCAGEVFGKPASFQEAQIMLQKLQGRWHEVYTGVALVQGDTADVYHEVTQVQMAPLGSLDIDRYIETGEPLDKAGAYGIQGAGAAFIEAIQGCYTNVVGLPLPLLYRQLKARGWFVGQVTD